MAQKTDFRRKSIAVMLTLALLAPMLVGCSGGDGDETPPPVTLDEQNPVKIGLLADWSGPSAIAGLMADEVVVLVEKQVRDMGGILDGRPVEFEKADGRAIIDEVIIAFKKLALEDEVSAIVGGSYSPSGMTANIPTAGELRVPYFFFGYEPSDLTGYEYTVRAVTLSVNVMARSAVDFVINQLKAEKVAFLSDNEGDVFKLMKQIRDGLESDGVEIVYEEYADIGTVDFSPYLTDLKKVRPDVIIGMHADILAYVSIFKDVEAVGGWGDIKYLSLSPASAFAINTVGAEGTYHLVQWAPWLTYPANLDFIQAFKDEYGRDPTQAHFYFYVGFWTAINAIELAGSDNPQDVAKAARSGHLSWESPAGLYKIDVNGEHSMTGFIVEVKGGDIVVFEAGK